ncbi:MAG: nuclease, partial [Acidobacteria bacterium]
MRIYGAQLQLSASDLAKHLACRHLTWLDLMEARGELRRPLWHDSGLIALEQRGLQHERAYLDHLRNQGLEVLEWGADAADAMKRGVDAIAQADLSDGRWRGRADVLLRVNQPSKLGNWSYEVVDTKLARETRGGTILQLCLYSELVAQIQGHTPEFMHVVIPGNDFKPEKFRVKEYEAYYRYVKKRLEQEVQSPRSKVESRGSYPDPVEHCDLCNWWSHCNAQRRKDDHLSFVAGITKAQIRELKEQNVTTLLELAHMSSAERIRQQARLQLEYRETKKPVYEILEIEADRGLCRLPEPSKGDIFLDFEADPFVENGGLEYLLGYSTMDGEYTAMWALNRIEERRMFESFLEMVIRRLNQFPDLHIYHFSPYEPTALKRLAGRYSSRQDELDRLLRGGVFVDLYAVVKQALQASVERYSIKDLEIFSGFKRNIDLDQAKENLHQLEFALELNDLEGIAAETCKIVAGYNRDDCLSTAKLRDWLETLRAGKEISRPALQSGEPSEEVDERRQKVLAVMDRLLRDTPEDPQQQNHEQHAKWLLAQMLEWHRREDKVSWWEYFRLNDLTDEELMDERSAISGLQFSKRIGG